MMVHNKTERLCLNCGESTTNPKFCSQSCAATYTNKEQPKRKRVRHFCECGKEIHRTDSPNGNSHYRSLCEECYEKKYHNGNVPKSYYREVSPTAYFTYIRSHARNIIKSSNVEQKCVVCGYTNHVEVCHKKGIAEFSDDTLVSEINSIDNLVMLCPNHHWEFDNGLIVLDGIRH